MLSQLTPPQMYGKGKDKDETKPNTDWLRGSKNLIAAAYYILLLHTSPKFTAASRVVETEVIVAKQKNGPKGIAHVNHIVNQMLFVSPSQPRSLGARQEALAIEESDEVPF